MARFSTSEGKFVGWARLPHGVLSLTQALVRKTTGHIPRVPWIPFSARRALQSVLSRESVVWEIGAGYSTLWLADRVKRVTSIEASKDWFERLSAIVQREGLKNVDLRFEWEAEKICDYSALDDGSLDLLFVDGGPRGLCLERGFPKVRSGGYVYLDNWDAKEFWGPAADFPETHRESLRQVQSFVDYVPAQFGVYEGLLLQKA